MTTPHEDPKFVHLHVHSSYSVGVGLATPEEICAHARRVGYDSVALTDTNGTYGFIELHLAAKRHGLKPIYGVVVYHTSVVNPGGQRFVLPMLATSRAGLANIAALASVSAAAYETGIALLIEQIASHADNVIAFVGSPDSEVGRLVLAGDEESAARVVADFKAIFGERLFVEIQDHGETEEKHLAQKLIGVARQCGVGTVLTQEVRYVGEGLREASALLSGVRHPHREEDFFRLEENLARRGMRSAADLARLRGVYPEAFANTVRIAESVAGDLFAGLDHATAGIERGGECRRRLLDCCTEAFYKRYPNLSNSEILAYQTRMRGEVEMIDAAGLTTSFLFYHKIFSALRREGIPLGPATGLVLQSFCASLLGITAYDPCVYDEAFQPMFDGGGDIEIQLTTESRDRTIGILKDVVGAGGVAYVPAIERITPARAVRMVARIVEVGEGDVDEILQIIARHPGASIKLLTEEDRQLGRLYRRSPPARELLTRAALLEDLPSGFIRSRRSAAVSAVTLTDILGHSDDVESDDVFLQAGRDVLPIASILRIDFTTLGAMGIVHACDRALAAEKDLDYGWDRFPVGDEDVWSDVQRGDTLGVFQFEGEMIQQQRSTIRLASLRDLVNFLALMRVRGDSRTSAERLKTFQEGIVYSGSEPLDVFRILKQTRGFLLYDEQLRDLITCLTGKKPREAVGMLARFKEATPAALAAVRSEFMRATADGGVPMDTAQRWFDRLLYHAGHTMGRERVLADALLVYKLFYLKRYHADHFYAGLLNSYRHNEGKLKKYLRYLRDKNLLLGVDVNASGFEFTAERGRVRTGLQSIPSLDRHIAVRIEKLREDQPFDSVDDFVQRLGSKAVPRAVVERLITAGAFGGTPEAREAATRHLGALYKRKTRAAKAKEKGQLELPFDE